MSDSQHEDVEKLIDAFPDVGKASSFCVAVQEIYATSATREEACERFTKLVTQIHKSGLVHMCKFAGMLDAHTDEILNYFEIRRTNAMLEGLNSIIQNIKRRARGFRNLEYFKTMIYLVCGKLKLDCIALF